MDRQQEIGKIAYQLYLQRRGENGDAFQDWLTAEKMYDERIYIAKGDTQNEEELTGPFEQAAPESPEFADSQNKDKQTLKIIRSKKSMTKKVAGPKAVRNR